jgi:hypothetical protein
MFITSLSRLSDSGAALRPFGSGQPRTLAQPAPIQIFEMDGRIVSIPMAAASRKLVPKAERLVLITLFVGVVAVLSKEEKDGCTMGFLQMPNRRLLCPTEQLSDVAFQRIG